MDGSSLVVVEYSSNAIDMTYIWYSRTNFLCVLVYNKLYVDSLYCVILGPLIRDPYYWYISSATRFYIWHCVPNILLWSILCKTVGLPSSTGESERTARRQFHSPTLRCFRGRFCEVAAGRGPLKQSRWPESNWTLPLRSVGVAPSLGRFWLVFTAFKLRYVLRRHIILSDSDGNQGVLDCFTVYPGLGGSAK